VQHSNAWNGWRGKGSQPFPEEQDLRRRDAAAAPAALSAEGWSEPLGSGKTSKGRVI